MDSKRFCELQKWTDQPELGSASEKVTLTSNAEPKKWTLYFKADLKKNEDGNLLAMGNL